MPYENYIRERMESGEPVFGASAITLSPLMIEVYARMDLDYVWLDHEHTGAASSHAPNFEMLRRTADAAEIEPVVRTESSEESAIRKILDAGIRTFVVPRVETADEVRSIVRASKFDFEGETGNRGVGTCLSSNWGDRSEEYLKREDETVFPGVMLENKTALENIEEILSVPGLGFVHLGPTDLSVSMGHPLQQDHPKVRKAVERFFDAAKEYDVPIASIAKYEGSVDAAVDRGSEMVLVGSEVGAVRQVLSKSFQDT